MSENAVVEIKIGSVEVRFSGPVPRERIDDVLQSVRAQLPELLREDTPAGRAIGLGPLLDGSDARTFGEKAGVVAYWLEETKGRANWRSADIVDALREIGEDVPKNITDALNQKLKKNLFEVHDRRWCLSEDGRAWVRWRLLGRDASE